MKILQEDFRIELAVYPVIPFVELVVAGGLQPCLVPAHKLQHLLGVLAHLKIESRHRNREGLYLLAESLVKFFIQFPVGARLYLNVLLAGIVIIPGQFLGKGFLLYVFQDTFLVLGLVFVHCRVEGFPQRCQGMAPVVLCECTHTND